MNKYLIPLFIFGLFACGDSSARKKITGVQRIFMHDTTTFSFMIVDNGTQRLEEVDAHNVLFVLDVLPNETDWAEASGKKNIGCIDDGWNELIIHLHSPAEVEGGGWDHGKSGHGTTNVVE
jgi:hypothetical protein